MEQLMPSDDLAFVTEWAPEPEMVVDLTTPEFADDATGHSEVIAYLAVVHAELMEVRSELQTLHEALLPTQ